MAMFPNYFASQSIFQTQGDVYRDSFGNPINPANMNPGWGIDPNLLTPSYDAPYRPQYSGSQPYNQYGRVGFFGGLNRLYNPFIREPYWGNPVDHQQPSIEGISNRPFDAAAWTGQRVVAPALAFGLAYRTLAPRTFMGYFTGKGVAAGFGKAVGSGFGRGVATAVGMEGLGAEAAAGFMGVAGSLTGSLLLPMAVAQGALYAGQKALWNPYINTRTEGEALRRNFAGVSFSDATGNAVTGGGLGYLESNRMAEDITRAGIQDMTFSTSEYANIADLSARAGLMDNVRAKQITQRVKDVAEQIKLIMAISKDPDIKNAIEELAKLNLAGADVTGGQMSRAAQAYRGLGRFASEAGVSIQRLMNTVGSQGQYLYQSNGMTPYLGQLAAANVYSGFAAAQRVGLMTPEQLARMGGVEGATQASLTGQLMGTQTPYNMMAMYNQYISGRGGSAVNGAGMSPIGVTSSFGAAMVGDPLGTIGAMGLYGPQMAARQLSEEGSLSTENQVTSILDSISARRGPNGKYSAEQMYYVLTNAMGYTPDQARAFIAQRAGETDPTTAAQRMRGIDTFTAQQKRQTISQDFAYGGALGVIGQGLRWGRDAVETAADNLVFPITRAAGWAGDSLQSATDWLQFGGTIGSSLKVSDASTLFDTAPKANAPFKLIDTSSHLVSNLFHGKLGNDMSASSMRIADKINAMAKAGNADAIAFLQAKGGDRDAALGNLIRKNKDMFGADAAALMDPNHPENWKNFQSQMSAAQTVDYTPTVDKDAPDRVTSALNATAMAGVSTTKTVLTPEGQPVDIQVQGNAKDNPLGLVDTMQGVGAAYDIGKRIASGEVGADNIEKFLADPKNRTKYAQLLKMTQGKTGADRLKAIEDIVKRGAEQGTLGLSSEAFTTGATLDRYINNPSIIRDDKIRNQFLSAKAKNDTAGMNKAITEDLVSKNGGKALDEGLKNAGSLDFTEVMKIAGLDVEGDTQKRKLTDLLKSGKMDFTSYMNTVNALDQKNTVTKFDGAVDKFGEAVDRLKGGSSSSSGDGGSHWYNPLSWGSGNPKQDTTKQSQPQPGR